MTKILQSLRAIVKNPKITLKSPKSILLYLNILIRTVSLCFVKKVNQQFFGFSFFKLIVVEFVQFVVSEVDFSSLRIKNYKKKVWKNKLPKISQLATCVKTNWTVLFVFRFFSIVEDVERWALLSLVNNRARAARERPLRVAARSKQRHSIPGWFFWFLELWKQN